MKISASIFLAAALFTCSAATEKSLLKVDMFDEFHVFCSNAVTSEAAQVLRYEDKVLVLEDGTKIEAQTLKKNGELIDFRTICSDKAVKIAAAVTAVYADKPGTVRIGAAADWWFECYCNGRYVFANPSSGNGFWPPKSDQYIFDVPLRAGRNDLVFLVRGGAGGWQLATDVKPDAIDPDKPAPQKVTPKILYGPYLTNPGTTQMSISCVVQGRQPLELLYRKKGNKKWLKKQILIGGQLNDFAPVMRFDLKELQPATTYEYKILRRLPPEYRASEESKIYEFKTFSDKPQEFSFWLMADSHLPKRAKLARVRNLLEKRPELGKADMFVHLGDFASYHDNFQHEVFDSFLKVIPPEQKIVTLRGNHEFDGAEATRYLSYLGTMENKSYQAFSAGNVFFIALDSGHHLPPDSDNPFQRYTALNELDTLITEQTSWLEKITASKECANAKYRIVFSHSAIHSHADSFDYMVPRLQKMVEKFFKGNPAKCPISLLFAGHVHKYMTATPDNKWTFPELTLGGGGKKTFSGAAFYVKVKPSGITVEAIDADGVTHEKFTF